MPHDLTLADCCDRWSISRNAVKSRAAALGVELIRESSTRTVWPAEHLDLGDELHQHLQRKGGTLANFAGGLVPPTGATDPTSGLSVAPPAAATATTARPSVLPSAGGSDALLMLLAALQPLPPADHPLHSAAALQAAARAGHWLTTAELAEVLGLAETTVRNWKDGHSPRPGYRLERRQERRGAAAWWRVVAVAGGSDSSAG
ncbi:MAG: hypothetical protein VKM34_02875 [Cyanobacteriota bacterium]|nr:hypothetical protein [Cyanobacteriota bacterium]